MVDLYKPSDALLDSLIQQESGGDPFAVNPRSGAQGLVQVMPETAKNPGFGVSPLGDPFDPVDSRRFASDYLGALLQKYNGNQRHALAAYNWGTGNVDEWLQRGGDETRLPAETQDYITKITGRLETGETDQLVAQVEPQGAPRMPNTSSNPGSIFKSWFDDGSLDPTASIREAVANNNPDQLAKDLAVANELGMNVNAVVDNPEAHEEAQFRNVWNSVSGGKTPVLNAHMTNPVFAGVAIDSAAQLAKIENISDELAGHTLLGDLADSSWQYLRKQWGTLEFLGGEAVGSDEWMDAGRQLVEESVAAMQENQLAQYQQGNFNAIAYDVGMAGVQMLPALAGTLATANPMVGMAIMGGQVFLDELGTSHIIDNQGFVHSVADATFYAIAEAIPEALPLGALFKSGGKFVFRQLFKTAGLEGATEGVSQMLEDSYDTLTGQNPEMTWGEFMRNAGYATLIGTIMGGGMYTVSAPFIRDPDAQRKINDAASIAGAKSLAQLLQAHQSTPLAERAPDQAATFLADVLAAKGLHTVGVSVEGVNALLGPEKAKELWDKLGKSEKDIEDAVKTGSDFRLSAQEFAATIGSMAEVKELAEHIRLNPLANTAAEANEIKDLQEKIREQEEAAGEQAAPEATETEEKEPVEDKAVYKLERDPSDPTRYVMVLDGEAVGEIFTAYAEGSTTLHIVDIRLAGSKTGTPHRASDAHKVGTVNMRDLYKKLFDQNPYVKEIKGNRVTGSRHGKAADKPGEKKMVTIKRPKPKGMTPAEARGIAEDQIALHGMFDSAQQAGISDEAFEEYLKQLAKARQETENKQEVMELRWKAKRLTEMWKAKEAEVRIRAEEHIRSLPLYQAFNNIGRERLNLEAVEAIVGKKGLEALPKQAKGRQIFVKDGKIDPWVWAEQHGFDGADIMLFQMIDHPRFDEAVDLEVQNMMTKEAGYLSEEQRQVSQAIEALHNDAYAELLRLELHWMNVAKKEKMISTRLIKAEARRKAQDMFIKDIVPEYFFRAMKRAGTRAGHQLRAGSREAAVLSKWQQIVNFHIGRLAYDIRAKVAKDTNKLNKITSEKRLKKLPEVFQVGIRGIMENNQIEKHKGSGVFIPTTFDVAAWVQELEKSGHRLLLPDSVVKQVNIRTYNDYTLADWNNLVDAVQTIYQAGVNSNKLFRADRTAFIDQEAMGVAAGALRLKDNKAPLEQTRFQKFKENGRHFITLITNISNIMSDMDGGKLRGRNWETIVGRIHDAVTKGYTEDQVGLNARKADFGEKWEAIFKDLPEKERKRFKKAINIPGVTQRISMERAVVALLNNGNPEGRQAMLDANQLTEAEIQAIADFMSPEWIERINKIWELMDSYWPEIKAAMARRHLPLGPKVEAVQTKAANGTLKGGYWTLSYDKESSVFTSHEEVEQLIKDGTMPGRWISLYTQPSHTKTRTDNQGNPVNLEINVGVAHAHRVIYDLEMGDAVADVHKIWNHPDVKKAFVSRGNKDVHDQVQLWIEDMIVGEVHFSDMTNRIARWTRSGLTIGALSWNFKVAVLQPGGMLQTWAETGASAGFHGLKAIALGKQKGPDSIYKWINQQSKVMEQRSSNFNNHAINDALALFKDSFGNRSWAQKSIKWSFLPMIKAQRLADYVGWMSAYGKAMREGKPHEDAVKYADYIIERSQGSANFYTRTAWERGTVSRNMRQSDVIRAMNPMMSYFAAKFTIATHTLKHNNWRTFPGFMKIFTKLSMLFFWEALFSTAVNMAWSAMFDEDDKWKKKYAATGDLEAGGVDLGKVAHEFGYNLISSGAAGVPFARDIVSASAGFQTGGAEPAMTSTVGELVGQLAEAKADKGLYNAITGTLPYIPGISPFFKPLVSRSVTQKYIPAFARALGGDEGSDEETSLWVSMFGE